MQYSSLDTGLIQFLEMGITLVMIRALRQLWRLVFPIFEIRRFRRFTRKQNSSKIALNPKIFLIESPPGIATYVTVHLFLKSLRNLESYRFVSYRSGPKSFLTNLKEYIRFHSSIESGMGIKHHFYAGWQPMEPKLYRTFFLDKCGLKDPELFERFEYRGILVGDLIYDDFLRRSLEKTVNFDSPHFLKVFYECLSLVDIYLAYFDKNKISGIAGSNSVYHFGIPLRIALSRNIPTFLLEFSTVKKLTKYRLSGYSKHLDYKPLNSESRSERWEQYKKSLENRIERDLFGLSEKEVVKPNVFSQKIIRFQKNTSVRTKILVLLHSFSDAPHAYGFNFYPDFYLWLCALGRISQQSNYDWFIKVHPSELGAVSMFLKEFTDTHPNFQILPSEITHPKCKDFGIDIALTVYGTAGWELPALGIPVITASPVNPHVNFSFAITPADKTSYENLLLNLERINDFEISLEEITQFYFLHYVNRLQHLVYIDYSKYVEDIGGPDKVYSPADLKLYMDYAGSNRRCESEIIKAICNFVASDDLELEPKHFYSAP